MHQHHDFKCRRKKNIESNEHGSNLNDYVTDEGFLDEGIGVNMAQIVSANQSSFEEANKSPKWRLAMDAEMKAIERNETWKLTKLLVGVKRISNSGFIRQNSMNLERYASLKQGWWPMVTQ